MKRIENSNVLLTLCIGMLLSVASFGQVNFHVPYWNTEFTKEAKITPEQITRFQEIENEIAAESADIRAQQLFWKEHNEEMQALLEKKQAMQREVISSSQLEVSTQYVLSFEANLQAQQEAAQYRADDETPELSPAQAYDWTEIMERSIAVMNEYYGPERAILRNKLEAVISQEDKEKIEALRLINRDMINANLELASLEASGSIFNAQDIVIKAFNKTMLENLMSEASVHDLLTSNPENYYAAKELAVKYDAEIDRIQKEMLLLLYSSMEELIPNVPSETAEIPSLEAFMSQYAETPEYVEISRNVLFLLLGGSIEEGVISNRATHTLSIYPVPASDVQTIQFNVEEAGQVTIDLIGTNGQLIQEVFSGNMDAGAQRLEVNVQEIQANVYFYRVTSKEGTSIVKSIKLN